MTRQIKFRGKHIKTGKWVYGLPQQKVELYNRGVVNLDKPAEIGYIVSYEPQRMLEPGVNDENLYWNEIDPKTLGEYIGIDDKHNKEIFEGDIVKNRNGVFLIRWDHAAYWLAAYEHNPAKAGTNKEWEFYDYLGLEDIKKEECRFEVIGNIYEQPELLEQKGESE